MDQETKNKVREFLDKQRETMQGQIQFAESKHTILLAFNGASVVGSIAAIVALGQSNNLDNFFYILIAIYAVNVSLMCSVAVFYNLASMYAQRHQFKVASQELFHSDNLVFWGTIATYSSGDEYLKKLLQKYWQYNAEVKNHVAWSYELEGADQVRVLAQIARRKYNLFNESVRWTMAGLLTPFAIIIQKYFVSPDLGIQESDGNMYYIQPLKTWRTYE